jgi:hypothetical protein
MPQQTPFARQNMYTRQKSLQSLKVGFVFCHNQFLFPFLPCTMLPPRFANLAALPRCVDYPDAAKPCTLNEPFVLPRRSVDGRLETGLRV